ncbi:TPA: hypothetical protein GRI81_23720 [Vibrio parahaemolyticus]|uniref:hypothetical protein n=1 Tax=Vibrio vulnificus TaxID=672 RepID=UPI001A25CB2E|nr:hypothetical protein [Vibrio parahaemolyticus]
MEFEVDDQKLAALLNQRLVPVLYRTGEKGAPLYVKLPFEKTNMAWLRNNATRKPKWNAEHKWWETPKAWFNDLVKRCLHKYGKVYVIQPYRQQEKCAPACWNAEGHECQCSCMGEHHGSMNSVNDWYVVSDTFATKWHHLSVACRLMTKK